MLRNLCVVLVCMSVSTAFGQQKFSISATVAPTLVRTSHNRTYLFPESDGQIVEPVFLRGIVNAFGYSGGLTAQYMYAPGWSVATGVWYNQATFRQARSVAAGEGTTAIRSRTMRFPLLLNYQPSARRLSPYFSVGLLLDFPLTSRVVVTRSGQTTQRLRLRAESGPVFQPQLGAGGRYRADRHWTLIVQPVWAYNLGRFGGARTYNSSYEVGLLTQVMYSF